MLPHDGVGARTPTPRMRSVPSATMATAMPSSAIDNIAGSTFGSTSRTMMRPFFAPCARAASTNSRCDQLSALAREIRPSSGIETMPMARMSATSGGMPPPFAAWSALPSRNALIARARTVAGTDSSTLKIPVR